MFHTALPETLAELTLPFHQACTSLAPKSRHSEFYSAMVCGSSISRGVFHSNLSQTGLLHLLVVSGSHLVFLETLIRKLMSRVQNGGKTAHFAELVIWVMLLLFTLANRGQPPVLRAFSSLLLHRANDRYRLSWTTSQVITASTAATIPFCLDERDWRSLTLSWTAALAISAFSVRRSRSHVSRLKDNALVYLLMLPPLLPLSAPGPLTIICNFLLAPFLGLALFPLCLLAFVIPSTSVLIDQAWNFTLVVVEIAAQWTPPGFKRVHVPLPYLLVYTALLTAFVWRNEPRRSSS